MLWILVIAFPAYGLEIRQIASYTCLASTDRRSLNQRGLCSFNRRGPVYTRTDSSSGQFLPNHSYTHRVDEAVNSALAQSCLDYV